LIRLWRTADLGAIILTKGSGRISSRLLRTNAPRTGNENDRAQIARDGRRHATVRDTERRRTVSENNVR
jgi:hypothetical protein